MIKTELDYNEDNFLEVDGKMQELTVTITLAEYRNLIFDQCIKDEKINELYANNDRLVAQLLKAEEKIKELQDERKEARNE